MVRASAFPACAGRCGSQAKNRNETSSYYIDSYNATSVARVFSRHVSSADVDLAGTGAGLLMLTAPCQTRVCSSATVSQLSTATGAAISTVSVPYAVDLVVGPSAAVVSYRSEKYYLVRLAG